MIETVVILLCLFTINSANVIESLIEKHLITDAIPNRIEVAKQLFVKANKSVAFNFIELVEQYNGYTAKEYKVTTVDGYNLGLFRITASPNSTCAEGKPAVYLQHGFFGNCNDFVILGPKKSLAFQLADAGYDVWLGNIRGSTYSRSHMKYSPEDSQFWAFSLDEVGLNDVSKSIDIVLEQSGRKNCTYIGYSSGALLGYILLSTKLEYNEKINLVVGMGPAAYFQSPIKITTRLLFSVLTTAAKTFNLNEVFPHSDKFTRLAEIFCHNTTVNVCALILTPISDNNSTDVSIYSKTFNYFPVGSSYGLTNHIYQIVNNGTPRKYSYPCDQKPCKNEVLYNQTEPPIYDLSLITAPSVVFSAPNDGLVATKDSIKLSNILKNCTLEIVPNDKFNHLNYIWGATAKSLVYDRILEIMSNYTS